MAASKLCGSSSSSIYATSADNNEIDVTLYSYASILSKDNARFKQQQCHLLKVYLHKITSLLSLRCHLLK